MRFRKKIKDSVIKDIQENLLKLGYSLGPTGADGNFGPLTECAVIDFQKKHGIKATGKVDKQTYYLLVEKGYSLGDRLLYLHYPYMRGNDVLELQKILKSLGFNPGPFDGIFGTSTEKALREFQASTGLQQDGILGPMTLKCLNDLTVGLGVSSVVDYPAREPKEQLLLGKIIAIDAGHGGKDPGAIGSLGTKESVIARDICSRLESTLESLSAKPLRVYAPRESRSVGERAAAANNSNAQIFISLHLNGSKNKEACGTETLYFKSGNIYSESGRKLAEIMQTELVKILRRPDRGIKGRNLPILKKTVMPAVLIEPLFITNREEEELLRSEEWRQRIAMAVLRGIEKYFKLSK